MKLVLADALKVKKIQVHNSKVLNNHLIHIENKIVKLLKKLQRKRRNL